MIPGSLASRLRVLGSAAALIGSSAVAVGTLGPSPATAATPAGATDTTTWNLGYQCDWQGEFGASGALDVQDVVVTPSSIAEGSGFAVGQTLSFVLPSIVTYLPPDFEVATGDPDPYFSLTSATLGLSSSGDVAGPSPVAAAPGATDLPIEITPGSGPTLTLPLAPVTVTAGPGAGTIGLQPGDLTLVLVISANGVVNTHTCTPDGPFPLVGVTVDGQVETPVGAIGAVALTALLGTGFAFEQWRRRRTGPRAVGPGT